MVGLFEEAVLKLHSEGLHVEATVLAVAFQELGLLKKNSINVDAMSIALTDSFALSDLNTAGICLLNLIKEKQLRYTAMAWFMERRKLVEMLTE